MYMYAKEALFNDLSLTHFSCGVAGLVDVEVLVGCGRRRPDVTAAQGAAHNVDHAAPCTLYIFIHGRVYLLKRLLERVAVMNYIIGIHYTLMASEC